MSRNLNIFSKCILGCGLALAVLVPLGSAQAKGFVLHSFTGSDGAYPSAGLIADGAGNLYGTTDDGGSSKICLNGCGTVFKLAPDGTETVLYSFTGSDGFSPSAGLIMDSSGNLYGTTYFGGADGYGVVFKLAPDGTETVLHSFTGGSDGGGPLAGLIMDSSGNLYGTTYFGGADGFGTVFKLAPNGTETVLHSFTGGSDGEHPLAGVIMDSSGNLYSTTNGSADDAGVVFKLAPNGTETVLYSFTGGSDGEWPRAGLIMDSSGNLYSTTSKGGAGCNGIGCGTVFKLAPNGTETVLYSFCSDGYPCTDGAYPSAGLIMDKKGNLYSTTEIGGADDSGVVFKLAPDGTETVLHTFTRRSGRFPQAGLIMDKTGSLYGTAYRGGADKDGVVFKLKE